MNSTTNLPVGSSIAGTPGRKRCAIILLLAASLAHASAQEEAIDLPLEVKDFGGYQRILVKQIEPDGVTILHDTGVTKIRIEDLPEALKVRFDLTEKEAQEFRKEEEVRREREEAERKKREYLESIALQAKGQVAQVMKDGLRLEFIAYTDGELCEIRKYETIVLEPRTMAPPSERHPSYFKRYAGREWKPVVKCLGPGVIKTNLEDYVENACFEGTVYPIGTITYNTVLGSTRTIRLLTTDPEEAWKHHTQKAPGDE